MSTHANDLAILDSSIGRSFSGGAWSNPDEHFEFFAIERILGGYGLSDDEVMYGHVDGQNDGGLDGFYTFVNGTLVQEDTNLLVAGDAPSIDVWLIQAKNTGGFPEKPLGDLLIVLADLLNFTQDYSQLESRYNDRLINAATCLRRALTELGDRDVQLEFHYRYVTRGDASSAPARQKLPAVKGMLSSHFARAREYDLALMGASELLQSVREGNVFRRTLKYQGGQLSSRGCSYAVLVRIKDFVDFLSNEEGALNPRLFEQNVRAYRGDQGVNQDIRASVKEPHSDIDFWWLNNGVTILSTLVVLGTGELVLTNPQVVNGLQTSTVIHGAWDASTDDERCVLVKVVQANDQTLRNRIIKATNFQNKLPAVALRASDPLQSRIEMYFDSVGLLYERQQNFYRNQGRSPEEIVTLPYLGQAVMAVLLQKPDFARARPSTLLDDENDYRSVFDAEVDLAFYANAARIMKAVDLHISTIPTPGRFRARNFRFHIAMYVVMRHFGRKDVPAQAIASLSAATIDDLDIVNAWRRIETYVDNWHTGRDWSDDKTAKNADFRRDVRRRVRPSRRTS